MRKTAAILVVGVVVGAGVVMVLGGLDAGGGDTEAEIDPGAAQTTTATQSGAQASSSATVTDSGGTDTRTTTTAEPTDTVQTEQRLSNIEISAAIERSIATERETAGAGQLNRTAALDRLAHHHSLDMASSDFFSNESPWGDTLEDRMVQEDVHCSQVFDADNGEYIEPTQVIYRTAGETLPAPDVIADDSVARWVASDDTRAALHLEEWTEVGIATRQTTDDGATTAYVTVVFC